MWKNADIDQPEEQVAYFNVSLIIKNEADNVIDQKNEDIEELSQENLNLEHRVNESESLLQQALEKID